MKDQKMNNLVDGKGNVNPVIAAVASAVVAAGAVVAGMAVLNDEKNQKKAQHILKDAKNQSVKAFNDVKKDVRQKVKKEAKDILHRIER